MSDLMQQLQDAPVSPRACQRCALLKRVEADGRHWYECGWKPATPLHWSFRGDPHIITAKMIEGPHEGDEIPCDFLVEKAAP